MQMWMEEGRGPGRNDAGPFCFPITIRGQPGIQLAGHVGTHKDDCREVVQASSHLGVHTMNISEWVESTKAVLQQQETAGILGSILAFLNSPGRRIFERAFNLLSGVACSIYVAPFIIYKLDVSTLGGRLCTAFLVGLLGMRLTSKLLYLVAGLRPAEIKLLLLRLMGDKRS